MTDPTPHGSFADRHIGPSDQDVAAMLTAIGVASLDQLVDEAVPEAIRTHRRPDVAGPLSETDALAVLRKHADRNEVYHSFIGMGYYGTITPA